MGCCSLCWFRMSERASCCFSDVFLYDHTPSKLRMLVLSITSFSSTAAIESAGGGGSQGLIGYVAFDTSRFAQTSYSAGWLCMAEWKIDKPAGISGMLRRSQVEGMFWCLSGTQRSVELEQTYEAAARVFGIGVMDDYLWLNVSAL